MLSEEARRRGAGLVCGAPGRLTWKDVEDRLVEAAELWLRTPGSGVGPGGRGPWATDGPWHLLTDEVRAGGTWEAWRQRIDLARDKTAKGGEGRRPMGLTAEEVTRRDQADGWMRLIAEDDRQLVMAAIWQQARTGRRVDWGSMLRLVGKERGKNGVRMRYQRALAGVAARLSRAKLAA